MSKGRSRSELREAIKNKIAAGVPLADIKQTQAGRALGGSNVQNIYRNTQSASAASASAGTQNPSYQSSSSSNWSPADFSSIYETLQVGQQNLANIQGQWSANAAQIAANAEVSSAGIRADADKEVAKAYADAQKYGSELGLEGVKYGADKESEWRQAVANIESGNKLKLQEIINAGLQNVANIEKESAMGVAETTGKYSLQSMQERTKADRDLGKMQLAGNMYGLIAAAFG